MLRLLAAAILVVSLAMLPAYAQGSGEVAGRYKNARTGLIIDLPQGWTGTDGLGFPIVSPTGMVPGGKWPAVNMAIMSTGALKAKEIWQDPEYSYSLNSDAACKELARNYVLVAKVRASEVVKECDDQDYSKTKTYAIATRDNIIVIRFSAESSNDYDAHIAAFEKSVGTLLLYTAIDMKAAVKKLSGMHGVLHKVAGGKQATVRIDTTSSISDAELGKAGLSFDVAGKKGIRGVAEVSIGAMASGPYQVTIDGKATDDFKVTRDMTTGETLLSVNYGHGARHRVAITGL
ncbi:MAG: hypothetical protein ACREAY_10885 [Nitrososphaera sp.]|uniref:hypothetical protein n=1 Tax=Nitrososphaera sp. TaxID=1971748 RepID=UPI003D6E7B1F